MWIPANVSLFQYATVYDHFSELNNITMKDIEKLKGHVSRVEPERPVNPLFPSHAK